MVNLFWSPFPTNRSTKTSQEEFGEYSEQNSGQNSGRKSEKSGKPSLCNLSDLMKLLSEMFRVVGQAPSTSDYSPRAQVWDFSFFFVQKNFVCI